MKILSFILSTTMFINSIPSTSVYAGPLPKLEDDEITQTQSKSIPASPYVGTDDFKKMIEKGGFVDKSLLIKAILDDPHEAILALRPRRGGKSLNLDMLNCFFRPEVTENGVRVSEDYRENLGLFERLNINSGYIDTREIVNRILLSRTVDAHFRDNHETILEIAQGQHFENKDTILREHKERTLQDTTLLKTVINYTPPKERRWYVFILKERRMRINPLPHPIP